MPLNLRTSYKYYKKNAENPVSVKIYVYVLLGFLKFMMQKIFDGKDVRLPAKLGVLGIRGKKVKPRLDKDGNIIGLAPNWKKTIELWNKDPEAKEKKKMVYHFNEHTNGLRYKIHWFKTNSVVKNIHMYSIRFSRDNKRMVTQLANSGKEYLEIKSYGKFND